MLFIHTLAKCYAILKSYEQIMLRVFFDSQCGLSLCQLKVHIKPARNADDCFPAYVNCT